ncbi:hypothetical protein D3C71_1508990 [compost metagenome]
MMQAHFIRIEQIRNLGMQSHAEIQMFGFGGLSEISLEYGREFRQIHGAHFDLHFSGFNLG